MNLTTSGKVSHRTNQQGLTMVNLQLNKKIYTRSVALLVARAFLPPSKFPSFVSVIHLNGDRSDCRLINLMWRSRPFALQYHAMFDKEPLRRGAYIPQLNERYSSLRDLCTTYGLIEWQADLYMFNGERAWPYNWNIEET